MVWCTCHQIFFVAFLFLFPILWQRSQSLRYWMKMGVFYTLGMATGVWAIPYALTKPFDINNMHIVQRFWQVTFKIFGFDIVERNFHHLVSEKPLITVCNHQSSLDLIPMMQVAPVRWSALAKKELLYAGPFGLAAYLCGVVFVDRFNREKARKTMDETVKIIHEKRMKLWVYPEGTRNLKRGMLPFRKGAFNLAVQAQVPIVPIVFSAYETWLDTSTCRFDPGKIIITVLPPVPTEGLGPDDVNSLSDKIREMMLATYEETSAEVLALHDSIGKVKAY